jgi:hypothetical protein
MLEILTSTGFVELWTAATPFPTSLSIAFFNLEAAAAASAFLPTVPHGGSSSRVYNNSHFLMPI